MELQLSVIPLVVTLNELTFKSTAVTVNVLVSLLFGVPLSVTMMLTELVVAPGERREPRKKFHWWN